MNTESPLVKELLSEENENQLFEEAKNILKNDQDAFTELLEKESGRLFNDQQVRKICLKYRLRFLDISFFKNELPEAALSTIVKLESDYGIKIKQLKVIAPGELFNLENREKDPILVAELAKGVYLYIHKWGNEFNFWRAVKAWPMKNIFNMVLSIGVISLMINLLIGFMTVNLNMTADLFLFGWTALWIGCTGFAAIMAISKSVFPTVYIWKSKFLD